jgi:hypothetical protein
MAIHVSAPGSPRAAGVEKSVAAMTPTRFLLRGRSGRMAPSHTTSRMVREFAEIGVL